MKNQFYLLTAVLLLASLLSACGGEPVQPVEQPTTDQAATKVRAVEVAFTGVVEEMTGNEWTVNGQVLTVDPAVVRDGPFQKGDTIKVEGIVNKDGSLSISRVEAPTAAELSDLPRLGNGDANSNDGNANSNEANSNETNLNSNMNTNANDGNTNGSVTNSNTNANTNDDSSNNLNANDNSNDDDDGNTNGNDNTNDDGGNTNGNSNNSNDDNNDNGSGGGNNNNDDDDNDDNRGSNSNDDDD